MSKIIINGVTYGDNKETDPTVPQYVKDIKENQIENWDDSTTKKHVHENKSVIDKITSDIVETWNAAYMHISDTIKHITSTERTNWNSAYKHSQADHARIDATKTEKSNNNGNIKINGTETTVYSHPGTGTNPHGTTKSDIGLSNVDNTADSTKNVKYAASAGSATKATQDSDGNQINTTYVKKNNNTDANGLLNALEEGTATPNDKDYYISQYAGGGTTYKTYYRRPVSALWTYIKGKLATVATSGSYNDLVNKPTIPTKTSQLTNDSGYKTTDNNTTYSLTQDKTDGHKITLTPSNGTAQTITIPDNNTNTWRGIQNNLTSDSTTDSLSAAQGKALNNKFSSYLPLGGGTLTGNLQINTGLITGETGSYKYSHAIELGIPNRDHMDFFEYGGIFNFYKHQNGTSTKLGYIDANGWNGNVVGNCSGSAGSVAWGNITGKPSSMPASDVYSWAKASSKPSYKYSEVGAAAASHTHSQYLTSHQSLASCIKSSAYTMHISAQKGINRPVTVTKDVSISTSDIVGAVIKDNKLNIDWVAIVGVYATRLSNTTARIYICYDNHYSTTLEGDVIVNILYK